MKPITLSPDQLDAALAVDPVRHLSPLQVDHVRNVRAVTPLECGVDYCGKPPVPGTPWCANHADDRRQAEREEDAYEAAVDRGR